MLFNEYLLQGFAQDAIILKNKNEEYTLKDILRRCKLFVNTFTKAAIKKGDRIILLMENGPNAVCLQLCCAEIGAIFIPVSPFEPIARILKIVEQFGPIAILVEDDKFKSDLAQFFPISCIGEDIIRLTGHNFNDVVSDDSVSENDILYIISTSGTTGSPKGIKMSHKAVVSFFKAIVDHCKLNKKDNVGSISPLQFDFSLLDLGLAWGSKCCITMFSQSFAYAPKKLVEVIINKKVTHFNGVPAIWNMIIRFAFADISRMTELKAVLYAGDKFTFQNIGILREKLPGLKIVNCFGQSESIACSFYDIPELENEGNSNISIGKGYGDSIFYIVDSDDNLIQDNNIVGELWLSNDSLFNGYWKNDFLTDERLVKDIFDGNNKNKVYKTGDLLSRSTDGNYFFHGRKDNQIKINGNRVELDEIEQVVLKHPYVADAAAVAQKNGDSFSVTLFISSSGTIEKEEIRKHCRASLPLYMLPSEIVILQTPFPLSINGKTDKKELLQLVN